MMTYETPSHKMQDTLVIRESNRVEFRKEQ